MTVSNIYWMAGLLEGEGCFSFDRRAVIQLKMTDRDVVEKAASIFKVNALGPYTTSNTAYGNKPTHHAIVYARKAVGWMMMVYPFMGSRRQAKIREILAEWKSRRARPNG